MWKVIIVLVWLTPGKEPIVLQQDSMENCLATKQFVQPQVPKKVRGTIICTKADVKV